MLNRLLQRRTRKDAFSRRSADFGELEKKLVDPSCATPMHLPLKFLKSITGDFSKEHELGRGAFGVVYKGILQDRKTIAVKKLLETHLDDDRFHNEVTYLIGLKHENVVQLLGYCAESRWEAIQVSGNYVLAEIRHRLICFEYINNKSLDVYLSAEHCGLEWHKRFEIIRGICYGLHYLHKECNIIHLDLKPQNILMDDNMVPKIADFGTSRLFGQQQSRIITKDVMGTIGYMAPEYLKKGLISTRSDIFSLGVIIIELLIGSRDYPENSEAPSGHFIKDVVEIWRNRLEKTSKYILYSRQVEVCTVIGLRCVNSDPKQRPAAWDIIEMLNATESENMCSGVNEEPLVGETGWTEFVNIKAKKVPQPAPSSGRPASVLPYKTANVGGHCRIAKKRFGAHEVPCYPWIVDADAVLSRLNKRKKMHCDFKPENLLFVTNAEDDPPLEVTDFGLSVFYMPGDKFSDSAKDQVCNMLTWDPTKRLRTDEVLCHPWILDHAVTPDKPTDSAVLSRLKHSSTMSMFTKMALKVISESISEEEIADLKEPFKKFDTDNSATITFDELKDGLKRLDSALSDNEIQMLMHAADIDSSTGTIDCAEFVAATLHMNKLKRDENLLRAFSFFDKDGNGYITTDDLSQACHGFDIDVVHLEDLIKDIDQTKDGQIDCSEFVAMLRNGNAGESRATRSLLEISTSLPIGELYLVPVPRPVLAGVLAI